MSIVFSVRSCSMHSPSMERCSSRGKIARQPSQIINQGSRCTHVEKPSKHNERDSFQHTKPKWQDSLRGSSSLSRNNSMEKGKRVKPSYYAVEALSHVSGQRFTNVECGLKSSANRRWCRYLLVPYYWLVIGPEASPLQRGKLFDNLSKFWKEDVDVNLVSKVSVCI